MNLQEQLERVTGQRIPVYFPSQLAALDGTTAKKVMATIDRHSRVLDIRDVIAGVEKPTRPLLLLVTDCRGGFLIQLREGLRKI